MTKEHHYSNHLKWTGNTGAGTKDYRSYLRDHILQSGNKIPIPGSSDPAFRGDPNKYNPEELLVASLSACHMLWFLHLCSVNSIEVIRYEDNAEGTMTENPDGSGQFKEVILKPKVVVRDTGMLEGIDKLHKEAHNKCFIANSMNFPVRHEPESEVDGS